MHPSHAAHVHKGRNGPKHPDDVAIQIFPRTLCLVPVEQALGLDVVPICMDRIASSGMQPDRWIAFFKVVASAIGSGYIGAALFGWSGFLGLGDFERLVVMVWFVWSCFIGWSMWFSLVRFSLS